MDSSNYGDREPLEFKHPNGRYELVDREFAGINGNICCDNGGQWEWINKEIGQSQSVKATVFSTHYDPYKQSLFMFNSRNINKPASIRAPDSSEIKRRYYNKLVQPIMTFLSNRQGKLYWLSAHTHGDTKKKKDKISISHIDRSLKRVNFKWFESYNVGSTTDYEPHVFIVSIGSRYGSYTELKLVGQDDITECNKLIKQVPAISNNLNGMKYVNGNRKGLSPYGLDRSYKDWTRESDYEDSEYNLELLINYLNYNEKSMNCLAYESARIEYFKN
jgi:hypothetical protein